MTGHLVVLAVWAAIVRVAAGRPGHVVRCHELPGGLGPIAVQLSAMGLVDEVREGGRVVGWRVPMADIKRCAAEELARGGEA